MAIRILDRLLDAMVIGGINRNDQVKRITMTSNGYRLYDCMSGLAGKVKYVNLSLHSTDFEERTKIFGTRCIPNNEEIVILTEEAAREGIDLSGVFVVDDFSMDMEKFDRTNEWCENHGLVSTRWRSNVFEKNKVGIKEFVEKLHQPRDLGLWTRPVLRAEGVEGQVLNTVFLAAV